ncbi:hypothetical protein [Alicyclobacillus sacchari]|uniref:hypothetical protein n=1 Tax=Alicyclobacillus sacchari TaxID=392010 RepID=UPI001416FC2F|nr:hypothetical protein [Alicyclobacillus sacchari]
MKYEKLVVTFCMARNLTFWYSRRLRDKQHEKSFSLKYRKKAHADMAWASNRDG